MNRIQKRSHGFASVMALVSLMVVGITVAGLTTRIAMEARRTEAENIRAQHEQILIARSLSKSIILPNELNPH